MINHDLKSDSEKMKMWVRNKLRSIQVYLVRLAAGLAPHGFSGDIEHLRQARYCAKRHHLYYLV